MTTMNEFGDEPDVSDVSDGDAVVETADEYGGEPEPPVDTPRPIDEPNGEQ